MKYRGKTTGLLLLTLMMLVSLPTVAADGERSPQDPFFENFQADDIFDASGFWSVAGTTARCDLPEFSGDPPHTFVPEAWVDSMCGEKRNPEAQHFCRCDSDEGTLVLIEKHPRENLGYVTLKSEVIAHHRLATEIWPRTEFDPVGTFAARIAFRGETAGRNEYANYNSVMAFFTYAVHADDAVHLEQDFEILSEDHHPWRNAFSPAPPATGPIATVTTHFHANPTLGVREGTFELAEYWEKPITLVIQSSRVQDPASPSSENRFLTTYYIVTGDDSDPIIHRIGETETVHDPRLGNVLAMFNNWWLDPKNCSAERLEKQGPQAMDVHWFSYSHEIIDPGTAHLEGMRRDRNDPEPTTLERLLAESTFAVKLSMPGDALFNVATIAEHPNYAAAELDREYLIISGSELADLQGMPEGGVSPLVVPAGIGLTYVYGPQNSIWVITNAELPNALMTLFGMETSVNLRPQNLWSPRGFALSRAELELTWQSGHQLGVNWHPKFLTLPQIAMTRLQRLREEQLLLRPVSDLEIFDRTDVQILNNLDQRVAIGLAKLSTDCLRVAPHSQELIDRWWPKGSADPCGTSEYGFTLVLEGVDEDWFAHGLAYGDNGTVQSVYWDEQIYVHHTNYGARGRYSTPPESLPNRVSLKHERVWSGNSNAFTILALADRLEFSGLWELPSVGSPPEPIVVYLEPGWSEPVN